MISDIQLEQLEKKYLDHIVTNLYQDVPGLINGLNSRIKILNDWKNQFLKTARKGYNASDLEAGAERIFHHFFFNVFKFPNSCPIGSDLMYKAPDAIIHIEIKTSLLTNPDYRGKIQLGRNQLSYERTSFTPNLPSFYESISKPALTYAIQIVHEHMSPKVNAISVICIPNGKLFDHYGEKILQAGKGGYKKGSDIRYNYSRNPYFILLKKRDKKEIFRIEILALEKNFNIQKLTGKKFNIAPHVMI